MRAKILSLVLLVLALRASALCTVMVGNWGNTNIAVLSDLNTNYFVLYPCTVATVLTSNSLVGQILHGANFTSIYGLTNYATVYVNCLQYGTSESLEVVGGAGPVNNTVSLVVSNLTCTVVQTNPLSVYDTNALVVLETLREDADGHTAYMCLGLGLAVFVCYRLGRK